MGKPYLPNLEPLIMAGIDPKTGLPVKFSGDKNHLKEDVKKFLRVMDEETACNRFTWYNLPCNLTSQELERMIYYRYQLGFFYNKDDGKFYFMPVALDGSVDFYSRWNRVHPIPWSFGTDDNQVKTMEKYLSTIKLDCVYGIKTELVPDDLVNSCVLLYDYTKQMSQTGIARANINDPILDTMSECVPMARTARLLSTGVKGLKVSDEGDAHNVFDANRALEDASMNGKPYIPIVGGVDFQDLQAGQTAKGEEYMLAMQSLDNLRLSGYGIDNGGLFEKKSHLLQQEANINNSPVGLVLADGLSIRQNFCNIVNSIWNLGIWCEPNECLLNQDLDGDGANYERNDNGENSGADASEEEETNE